MQNVKPKHDESLHLISDLRKFRGRQSDRRAYDGETQAVSVRCLMSLSGHLLKPIEIRPLCFYLFYKIYCGPLCVENNNNLTIAHSSKITRSPHSAKYCRYTTYSDALKSSFIPELVPILAESFSFCAIVLITEEFIMLPV